MMKKKTHIQKPGLQPAKDFNFISFDTINVQYKYNSNLHFQVTE